MREKKKDTNCWPAPPADSRGIPQYWLVATLAFQRAAEIELEHTAPGNKKIRINSIQGDRRFCHLVGFYDHDPDSFHLFRYFEDDQREPIYNPAGGGVDYKEILDLMKEWQEIACRRHPASAREVTALARIPGFDPLLYKSCKPRRGL